MTIAKGAGLIRPAGVSEVWLGAARVWPPDSGGSPPPPPPPPARSAPAFRSSTESLGSGSIGLPAGAVSGDLLVGWFSDGSPGATITPPSGWTVVGTQVSGGGYELVVAWKVAGGSEPGSYAYSSSAPAFPFAWAVCYSGADTSSPIGAFDSATGSGTTRTAPAVTAPYENSELLVFSAADPGAVSAAMTGMTELRNLFSDNAQLLYRQAIAAAGATGTRSQPQSSDAWLAHSLLINGAPVP